MPTTESKLDTGTLTIGGTQFAAQASAVKIVPARDTSGDSLPLLDGGELPADSVRSYTLQITAVQDFTDPAGFQRYSWTADGTAVAFTWTPNGHANDTFTGTVQVQALEVGGEVKKRLTVDAEWPCVGDVTWNLVADDA